MTTASTTARMITAEEGGQRVSGGSFSGNGGGAVVVLTEGQPRLPDLQVHREVRLQAQVPDRHVGPGLPLQARKLHVAVVNP